MKEYTIIMLGNGGVGKSSLTTKLITNQMSETYDPTIEDEYKKIIKLNNLDYCLTIVDTAGQEEFSSMIDNWIERAQGILVIFDISNRKSFEYAKNTINKIKVSKNDSEFPIVLVANKSDLNREVQQSDALKVCENYIETSAKFNINHKLCFYKLVQLIKYHKCPKKIKDEEDDKKWWFCSIL